MNIDPEDYADWDEGRLRSIGGGRKNKHRNPKSKTAHAKKSENIENAEEERVNEAKKRINQVIKGLIRRYTENEKEMVLDKYRRWINKCMSDNSLYLDIETDFVYEDFRSGGAGGQNVNKVSSGIRAKHKISGIFVRSTTSRDQLENKKEANSKLTQRLVDHLKDWRIVLTDGGKSGEPRNLTKEELSE